METTGENLFQVKKERSYISCLVNGCSYGFRHLGMLLRYMWPSLVLSTVLPIPFVFFFAAQVDAILRKWIELGYLPNVTLKVMRRDVEKCANRSALKVLIYIIWLLVVFVFLSLPVLFGIGLWWGLIAFIVAWLLLLPLSFVVMQIGYSNITISACFKDGLKTAYRNYGKLFAFEFLSNLLIFIIALLGSIPCQIIFAAGLQAYRGMQIDDVLDLPVLFPLYVALSVFILEAVLLITILVFSFSRCLMWGSLVNEVPTEPKADI